MTAHDTPATAVAPDRVLILNEHEQQSILSALTTADPVPASWEALADRVAYGDEYADPLDELIRVTLRKRRLEAAVRQCNARISDLDQVVVEQIAEQGATSLKHAATGATARIDTKVWAKVCKSAEKVSDDEKAAAAEGLKAAGLGDFVKPGFNTNTVSAYFREQIKAHRAEQAALPEHERRPLPVSAFLPPELVGLIELEDTPTISVRAS